MYIFENYIQIKDFMQVQNKYASNIYEEDNENKIKENIGVPTKVIQLKAKNIPIELIALDSLYDEVERAYAYVITQPDIILKSKDIKVGIEENLRYFIIASQLFTREKRVYYMFLGKKKDIFA